MPTHVPHTPIREGGLSDGCARCGEIAADPIVWLDTDNLAALLARTYERINGDGPTPRSALEAKAMDEVERILVRVGHIALSNPDALAAYLGDRWKVAL